MKTKLYSLFDSKAAAYGNIFACVNDASAVRAAAQLVNDPRTTISFAPEDYTLFFVAEFDDETGAVTPSQPLAVANCAGLRKDLRPAKVGAKVENAEVVQ